MNSGQRGTVKAVHLLHLIQLLQEHNTPWTCSAVADKGCQFLSENSKDYSIPGLGMLEG